MPDFKQQIRFDQETPERLDTFLSRSLTGYSRSHLQKNIRDGNVIVDGEKVKPNYKLLYGSIIRYSISEPDPNITDIEPEEIPLDIIFENDDVLVINKQAGLASHPTPNLISNTLVNALLWRYKNISKAIYCEDSAISKIRPGIVHRLDKDTTGVMIIAKNQRALTSLSKQIKNRNVIKKYYSLNYGCPDLSSGKLINYLGRDKHNRKKFTEVGESIGKKAISTYSVISSGLMLKNEMISLIEFQLISGRTHQIRSQSLLMGHPVLGDNIYFTQASKNISDKLGARRQMLHSSSLEICLPGDNKTRCFEAPLPQDFQNLLNKLIIS